MWGAERVTGTFTDRKRKAGARDAVALLTASSMDDHDLVESLIDGLGDRLPIVTCSIVGLVSGLLESLDDEDPGVTEHWLAAIGNGVEAMPEGDE